MTPARGRGTDAGFEAAGVEPKVDSRRRLKVVAVLFLAGPVVWYLHFWLVYVVAEAVCAAGGTGVRLLGLPLLSFVTVAATALAAAVTMLLAVRAYQRWASRGPGSTVGDGGRDGAEVELDATLAFGGFLLGLLFLVAVLFVGLPALFVSPC